jgi:deoxyribose-phosphate aldolase
MRYTYEELAGMIDHSLLQPTMTDADLEEGLIVARKYGVAAVCIKPYYVRRAEEVLRGSNVAVCTVIGFPHGGAVTESKRYETELACRDGATEIDVVINIGKALSGDWDYVAADIRVVAAETHRHGGLLKVIFENDFMPDDATKIRLCEICEAEGVDFVKTSTGYGFVKGADGGYSYKGATEHDLKLMRAHCSPKVRLKAAGGIRDLDALIRCRDLGCDRVGATATKVMLDEYRRREAAQETDAAGAAKLGTGQY